MRRNATQILAIMTPRRPMLLLVVWIGGFLVALGAAIASLHAVVTDYPVTASLVLIMATLLVVILALHLSAGRKLRRLRPILAGVPQTDQRITIAEIRQAINQRHSYQQLRRAAILNAVAFVISAATLAFMIYFRKPHASLLSDPCGSRSVSTRSCSGSRPPRATLTRFKRRNMRTECDPRPIRLSTGHLDTLMSAWALALLVLAASAGIGVKREFSDQSQGLRYAAKGEHDAAIASLSKAITAEPNNSDTYLDRAKSYGAKGDHDRAIADYTKAIEIGPSDAIAYRKRADAYRAKGALDNAITDYSKAIELDPKDALAYFLRGIAYAANKNSDHAIADFTKAIEIDPKDAYSYVSRARSFEAKGDHEHAIADFSKAIEIKPEYANAYYSRGHSHATNKNHDLAIADFTKAIEIEPKKAAAYGSRAAAYILAGARSLALPTTGRSWSCRW